MQGNHRHTVLVQKQKSAMGLTIFVSNNGLTSTTPLLFYDASEAFANIIL